MKQCAGGPDCRLFKSGNAALRQHGEPRVKFCIEKTPCRFVAPFEMPSVRASVVPWRVVPCDTERPVCTGKRTQKGKFKNIADIAGILITHGLSPEPRPFCAANSR